MQRTALLDSARIGADALRANPLRTVLSTTGVIIGVAALVAAFAVTDGVAVWSRQLIMRESSVQDVAVSSMTTRTVNGRTVPVTGYPVFTLADAGAARREVPGVVHQVLTLTGSAAVEYLDRRATVLLTLSSAGLAEFAGLSWRPDASTRSRRSSTRRRWWCSGTARPPSWPARATRSGWSTG